MRWLWLALLLVGCEYVPDQPGLQWDSLTIWSAPMADTVQWEDLVRGGVTMLIDERRQFCAYIYRAGRIMARSQNCPNPPGREVPEMWIIWRVVPPDTTPEVMS